MNIEFDSYKVKLNEIRPGLEDLADSLNVEGLRNELERLHAMQEAPGFWDNPEKSQQVVMKTKITENKIENYEGMLSSWDDLMTICEMAAEEDDDSMLPELKEGYEKLESDMERCRLQTLLTGTYDSNNAMVSFQAGAGGTEAQDWCQMLYRMYTRWAEAHGYTYKIMAQQNITLFDIIVGAMSQAFFTLSLGIGSMAIFGSYIDKEHSLFGEAINVALLDTFVAIVAGLIIFPACFTYNNGEVNAGPALIFQTIPSIFNAMGIVGQVLGSFFFLFLLFAALSTVFAVFENIIACTQELIGGNRKLICVLCGVGLFILSIPCILGYNVWSGFAPFGEGTAVLDLEDFIVSTLLLPIGSLVFTLFCVLKCGWGYDNFVKEANTGKGIKIQSWMKVYIKYILPVLLTVFVGISIVTFFL